MERLGTGRTSGPLHIGADGRYRFSIDQDLTRVTLNSSAGRQVCVASIEPKGSVRLDMHVVADPRQLGDNIPASLRSQQPLLSGVVYEETPEGRQPVPNAWVTLDMLYGLGVLIADTASDAQGRYVLCAVPQVQGVTLVVSASGFGIAELPVVGPSIQDVKLTRTR